MENKITNIANETKTENFDFKKHFVKASFGALYYLFVYIPFVLPFKIWGKAATRISLLWDNKSIVYREKESDYPLYLFYFNYIVNFIFDAAMFLAWPVGLIYVTYAYINEFGYAGLDEHITVLPWFYLSVLALRLAKETLFFIINKLVIWILEIIKNIGLLIKNIWLLNFVIKKKEK